MAISPRKAIRDHCKECVSALSGYTVEAMCASPNCNLFHYKRVKTLPNPPKTILKSIKSNCLECTGFEYLETKNCTDKKCNLYPYRLGRNKKLKGGPGRSKEEMATARAARAATSQVGS